MEPAQVELPLSGYRVEVLSGGVGLPQWRLHREGAVAYAASTDLVGGRKLMLGSNCGMRRDGDRAGRAWSLAFGAVPADGAPVAVTFARRRRGLGRPRTIRVDPVTVGDLIWLAEASGLFREVTVQAGALRETRYFDADVRARPRGSERG